MKLILGKLNNGAIFYWDISHMQLKPVVGDYAIVGNKNDYDLVKIIGIVETSEKYYKQLTHDCELKQSVCLLKRNMIRND